MCYVKSVLQNLVLKLKHVKSEMTISMVTNNQVIMRQVWKARTGPPNKKNKAD